MLFTHIVLHLQLDRNVQEVEMKKKTFFIHNAQLLFFHIRIKCPETYIRSSFLINPSRGVTRVPAAIKYRL